MITRRRLQRLESRSEKRRNEAVRLHSERDQARGLLARRLGVELRAAPERQVDGQAEPAGERSPSAREQLMAFLSAREGRSVC